MDGMLSGQYSGFQRQTYRLVIFSDFLFLLIVSLVITNEDKIWVDLFWGSKMLCPDIFREAKGLCPLDICLLIPIRSPVLTSLTGFTRFPGRQEHRLPG